MKSSCALNGKETFASPVNTIILLINFNTLYYIILYYFRLPFHSLNHNIQAYVSNMLSSIAWDQPANGLFERKSPDSLRVLKVV